MKENNNMTTNNFSWDQKVWSPGNKCFYQVENFICLLN